VTRVLAVLAACACACGGAGDRSGSPDGGAGSDASGEGGRDGAPLPEVKGAIAAGSDHVCHVSDQGVLHCWGESDYGQLGYGNTDFVANKTPREIGPVPVSFIPAQISAGRFHSCAVHGAGEVSCWGWAYSGALGYGQGREANVGDDESIDSVGPVDIGGVAVQVAAGGIFTCALLDTGGVRCWGSGAPGNLGCADGQDYGIDTPASASCLVDLGAEATQVATGTNHACAILDGGAVICWGNNESGALGYGTGEWIGDDEVPSSAGTVVLGAAAREIGAGAGFTCALLEGGSVRCWGFGHRGLLGSGSEENIGDDETPVEVDPVELGAAAVHLAVGEYHACAILEGGAVRCWGIGDFGRLGYGDERDVGDDESPAERDPVELGGPAAAIAAGGAHTCAIMAGGAVRCWGIGYALGYGGLDDVGDDESPASAGDVPL
jgi:alpha-tubulin suppressor-like RCC1 family protein